MTLQQQSASEKPMKNYRVVWEIDIEADSPEEAAQEAFSIMLDHESGFLPCFLVVEDDGKTTTVDLEENR